MLFVIIPVFGSDLRLVGTIVPDNVAPFAGVKLIDGVMLIDGVRLVDGVMLIDGVKLVAGVTVTVVLNLGVGDPVVFANARMVSVGDNLGDIDGIEVGVIAIVGLTS